MFSSVAEAYMAFDRGELGIGARCRIRLTGVVSSEGAPVRPDGSVLLETTLGRALFNEALPADYPYVNDEVGQEEAGPDRERPGRAVPEGRCGGHP